MLTKWSIFDASKKRQSFKMELDKNVSSEGLCYIVYYEDYFNKAKLHKESSCV